MKKSVGIIFIALTIVFALTSILLLGVVLAGPGYSFSFEQGLIGGADKVLEGTIELQSPAQLQTRLTNKLDTYQITYVVNKHLYFVSSSLPGTLAIENPPESIYNMKFSVYLDSGMHIYSSPMLKPAQHILSARLDKELPAGEYKATGYFSFYDPTTNDYIGRQGVSMTVTVEH